MTDALPRLILVTGAPRSGTTVVGQMLGLGRGVGTLHEPFNELVGLKEVEHYFEVPGGGHCSLEHFDQCVRNMRALRLSFKQGLFPREQGLRRAFKRIVGGRAVNSYRQCRLTPFLNTIIWKDPFACFAGDRVIGEHGAEVVVTLRNPWAVAASFKRMEWGFKLHEIFPRLVEAGIECPPMEGTTWDKRDQSAVNATLLWNAIYANLAKGAGKAHYHFVDLDQVVQDPLGTYKRLYQALALPWGPRVEAAINKRYQSSSDQSAPTGQKAHDRNRDLSAVNTYWSKLLDEEEINLVESVNGELWRKLESLAGAT